jgi:MFS transporter, FHS family, glucose/mannose:H+ symporter
MGRRCSHNKEKRTLVYNKKIAFAAACSGMLVFGMTIVTLGSLAKELQEKYSLSNYDSGTLFSILPFGLIIGSVFSGPVADRYGYRNLIALAAIGIFIGFEGIAYSNNLAVLRAFILLFGISAGVINGATNSIVVDLSDEHKGPNLSILGIFFGLGALGMPLLLGVLITRMSPLQVLAGLGWITLLAGITYKFVQFPPAKQTQGKVKVEWNKLIKPILILISFFLFFQSSLESIITNWTTIYIGSRQLMSESWALVALSIHMLGTVLMRVITGTLMRKASQVGILWLCLSLLLLGVLLMQLGTNGYVVIAGLFLSGAGVSGGFPVMLGFVGQHFPSISATAISFVFVVALIGNMLINYLTGVLIQQYGVEYLPIICYFAIAVMVLFFYFIVKQLNQKTN